MTSFNDKVGDGGYYRLHYDQFYELTITVSVMTLSCDYVSDGTSDGYVIR